jgi:hypothetical protein
MVHAALRVRRLRLWALRMQQGLPVPVRGHASSSTSAKGEVLSRRAAVVCGGACSTGCCACRVAGAEQ